MKRFLLLCFSFVFVLSGLAQERVVSGKVTSDEDGTTLPGVNVVLKGTTNGTVTDVDGNYRLNVPSAGGTLVFSFIGLQTQEVAIGERTTVDMAMSLDVKQLTEVVVTAQGIERDRKALGYAATTIEASDISNKPETDLGRALQGRTPGLQILNSSGMAGSGSKINIRGISSVSGNTQPLWVVDGVPINTATNESNPNYRDGQQSTSRFLDLDPNNIETINILRGLSATTLYGSLGRNGVILVTTKGGASKNQTRKFEATVSQSLFIVEAIIPEFQSKWGNGFDGDYGEFFSNWGALFTENPPPNEPRHPYYEHRNIFPDIAIIQLGEKEGYVPQNHADNVSSIFKKGTSSNTSINLGTSGDLGSLNFNYSHLDETGFLAHNVLQRDNLSLGGITQLTDKLSLQSTFNFARTAFTSPPAGSGGGNNSFGGPSIFANLYFTPRNIDLANLPYQNPITGANVYYRNNNSITNPKWVRENARNGSTTNRFFGNLALNYDVTDWLKLTYRLGLDTYGERQLNYLNKGSVGYPAATAILATGQMKTINITNQIIDHSAIATIQRKLSSDLDLTGIIGFNARTDQFQQDGLESTGQVVFGLIEHRNFSTAQSRDLRGNNLNRKTRRSWYGAYFDAGLGYKNFLYLNLTGRNDWVTTHEDGQNTLFYPGVSASFIPTAAFPGFAAGVLDFLKVRVGYGTSANFADPYTTRSYLPVNALTQVDATGNVPTQGVAAILANPNLKPELLSELEFGLEMQLLDNLARLDLSFYDRTAKNQILFRPLDPSTGYLNTYINAGEISNRGIEAGITITPVRNNAVVWNLRANITRNVSEVVSLPEGSKSILVSGSATLGNWAIEGEPFNLIQGQYARRDSTGNFLITANGSYATSNDVGIIGDPNPDWLGSVINDVTWKGITFSFQWDYVHGGDIYSTTATTGIGRGVGSDLQSFNPELPLILPGVKDSDKTTPNDIPQTTSGIFFGNSVIGSNNSDRGIFKGDRIRLREVSLGYTIPQSVISKLKIRKAHISLVGTNMWFKSLYAPDGSKADFDRTSFGVGNGAGFDYLTGPSARRYGVNLRLTF